MTHCRTAIEAVRAVRHTSPLTAAVCQIEVLPLLATANRFGVTPLIRASVDFLLKHTSSEHALQMLEVRTTTRGPADIRAYSRDIDGLAGSGVEKFPKLPENRKTQAENDSKMV